MKAAAAATLIIILVMLLVGCSSTPAASTPAAGVPPEESTEEPEPDEADLVDYTVVINGVNYQGDPARAEADEYVEVQNWQLVPADITGWVLKNLDHEEFSFTFPQCVLEPGETVLVYTNEVHPETGGFSFGSEVPLWDNDKSNTAVLYDATGQEISRYTY
jgi:hypothetical protein